MYQSLFKKFWKRTHPRLKIFIGKACSVNLLTDPTEKLDTLQSLCGAETFKYVDEATSYDNAILILDRKYRNMKSTLLARHQLRSLSQQSTVEAFFDTIINDVKRIQTPQLTAEQHRDQLIADVFICGCLLYTSDAADE